jgi:hypothetical protein
MGVISDKTKQLDKHIANLAKLRESDGWITKHSDFSTIVKEAEEIVKLASFLNSYKELDDEREKDVKEAVMVYLNRENTYDSTLLKCVEYCFGEYD